MPPQECEDASVSAWDEGYAAGEAAAGIAIARRCEADAAAREGLGLSLARLDAALAETLKERLRDTVVALCEATLAPLAMDVASLERRVVRAVAMLTRAEDDRTIRLHPEDMALVSARMLAEWQVEPDPALERGALRVETPGGGVEDGPAQWRAAIAEALSQC